MSIAEEWDDDSQPELDDFDGEADYDEHASGGGSRAYAEDYPSPVSTIPEASDEVRFLTEILDDLRRFVDEIWRF